MNKLYVVYLVLTIPFIKRVNSDPPKPWEVDHGYPGPPGDDQCRRMEFMDRGKVTDFLHQLKPNTDIQSVLDILGNSVTHAIRLCYSRLAPFDDFEVDSGISYICGSLGRINNLYSLYAESWKYLGEQGPEKDPLEFKITYKYTGGLNIEYYNPYVKLPMVHDIKGILLIDLKDVHIDLTLTTDPMTTMMEKLGRQQCFLHIKNYEASVSGAGHNMYFVDHETTYDLIRGRVSSLLRTKIAEIKESLKRKIKAVLYEGLVNSGRWVCLDDHVKEVIDEKLTSTRKKINSENFKKYCNE